MKLVYTKPCNECPWRRVHPAGWLGGYSVDAFLEQVQRDGPPLPCHKTIPENGSKTEPSMCAGALIFMKNSCKSSRHPGYGDARRRVERDIEAVFQWPHEFREHHSAVGVSPAPTSATSKTGSRKPGIR